ncbi:MAG: phosphatase PAP2 family protein [Treponema sp.]|nr:phosphatase PAP2 family protein [Treponema sp.]
MKKAFWRLAFFFIILSGLCAETAAAADTEYKPPSPVLIFNNMGWNFLDTFTFNHGLNFFAAGVGTWALIDSGTDWNWRNTAYNNTWLSNLGRPGLYIGYVVPALTPVVTYTVGRLIKNDRLQIASFALVQSLALTLAIQSPMKMITGRALPGIVNDLDHTRTSRSDNFSGEFNWFNNNFVGGWPSGHTANAFAAAATIAEIYNDNIWVQLGVYAYAVLIGFGVTLDVHWASEAFSGALIGYAVGKTVGMSYRKLLDGDKTADRVSLYFNYNYIGVTIKI